MKQLINLVAGAAIGIGMAGCSSMWRHDDASASRSSNASEYNHGMAGGTGAFGENPVHPGAYSEGGSAVVEDHRNDADAQRAAPAADRQQPTTPDKPGLGDSD